MPSQSPTTTSQATMSAGQASRVVFFGPDRDTRLLFEQCQVPEVREGEVLARVRLTTVCGSDLWSISGKRKGVVPSVLGHEAVAEVVENRIISPCPEDAEQNTHGDATDVKPGDRITFSVINSCQECLLCKKNLPQKCYHGFKYGHLPISQDTGFHGTYASHIILQRGTAIYKIPDHVTDKMAAPLNCGMATMVSAVGTIPKSHFGVAVIHGAGLLGMYGCALLKELGFSTVYVSDIKQERLLMVPQFGAIPYNPALPLLNQRGEVPELDNVDVVVEVCGSPTVIQSSIALLRPGGHLILVGLGHPDTKLDISGEQIVRKCLTITGIHNYKPNDLQKAVLFLSKTAHKYPYESLVGPEFPLKDVHLAVQAATNRQGHRVALKP